MTTYKLRRIEEDGTRVYHSYHSYKPVPLEERKIGVNKPDHPEAKRFHGRWFLPLDVLPEAERTMPETRPDTDGYRHVSKPRRCKCYVCKRPESEVWKDKARRGVSISVTL
jgi:hypothetical protein